VDHDDGLATPDRTGHLALRPDLTLVSDRALGSRRVPVHGEDALGARVAARRERHANRSVCGNALDGGQPEVTIVVTRDGRALMARLLAPVDVHRVRQRRSELVRLNAHIELTAIRADGRMSVGTGVVQRHQHPAGTAARLTLSRSIGDRHLCHREQHEHAHRRRDHHDPPSHIRLLASGRTIGPLTSSRLDASGLPTHPPDNRDEVMHPAPCPTSWR
jgi:hypothetical protein